MNGNVYKFKNSLIWLLMLDPGATVNVDLLVDYSVIYNIPTLTSFAQSGAGLRIIGPQNAILILPLNTIPPETFGANITRPVMGRFREVLTTVPAGVVTLTLFELMTACNDTIAGGNIYDTKASPQGK